MVPTAEASNLTAGMAAAPARPRRAVPNEPTRVGPLTPHLFAPSATRPVRAKRHELAGDTFVELHDHPWAQLTFSTRGVLRLNTEHGSLIVPPLRALWVPPDVRHSISLIESADLISIYLLPELAPPWPRCQVLEMSPLLRALVLSLDTQPGPHAPAPLQAPAREQLVAPLLVLELQQAPQLQVDVPLPQDKRLRALCEAVLRQPAQRRSLAEHAAAVGASERTLARRFQDELGMGWQQWQQQATLAHALPLLARGLAVRQVAQACGYATDSAFCAMFKAATGRSPTAFQLRRGPHRA